uniref:MFS domain-containing protein n=1 Tax=Parastrongyloides trichosuri TaxID=131310 RepID=A0A0N4ZCG1_PARTI
MHGNLFFLNILYIKDSRIKEYHSLSLLKEELFFEKEKSIDRNIIERPKRNISVESITKENAHPVPQDIDTTGDNKSTDNEIKNHMIKQTTSTKRIILTRSTVKEIITTTTTPKPLEWVDASEYIKNISVSSNQNINNGANFPEIEKNDALFEKIVFSYGKPKNYYKSSLETLFFSTPGLGMLLGLFPVTKCVHKFGIQRTLTTIAIINGCCMAFIPIILDIKNVYILLAIRFIMGFFTSANFAIIGAHIVNWEPIGDQTSSLNLGILSSVIGPILTWPLVNYCYTIHNTAYVHYSLSTITFLLTAVFFIFYRNDPTKHPWIRGPEIIKIRSCKILRNQVNKTKIFSQIIMCLDTWILVASSIAYFALVSFGLTYLPFFTFSTLHFSFSNSVVMSIIPLLFLILSHGLMNVIQYFINSENDLTQSRIFNSLAYFTSAAFLSAIIFITPNMGIRYLSYTLISCSFIPLGFVYFGFLQCTTSVGKHYGQYIVAMYQISFAISLSFLPFLVTFTVINNEMYEWKFFFLHIAILFFICNIVYIFLAEIEPLRIAEDTWLNGSKYHNNSQGVRLIGLDEDYGIIEMKEIK